MNKDFEKYTLETIGSWCRVDNPGETTEFYMLINDYESLRTIAQEARQYQLRVAGKNASPDKIKEINEYFDKYLTRLTNEENIYYKSRENQPGAYN